MAAVQRVAIEAALYTEPGALPLSREAPQQLHWQRLAERASRWSQTRVSSERLLGLQGTSGVLGSERSGRSEELAFTPDPFVRDAPGKLHPPLRLGGM